MKKNIIIVLACAIIAVGLSFGAYALYKHGLNNGRNEIINQVSENVVDLANAVSDKSEVSNKITTTLVDFPAEIDTDGISEYIGKLDSLNDLISSEEISNIIEGYKAEWDKFSQIYETEDNDAISDSFDNLRKTASETADKIKEALDSNIKNALDLLHEN